MSDHETALDFLNRVIAAAEAEDIDHHGGFIVTSNAPGITATATGPFTTPLEALTWAETWATELNDGNGPDDTSFTTTVIPLYPAGTPS